jgi:hypothetical protein
MLGLENELALRRKTERTDKKNYEHFSSHKRNQFVREYGVVSCILVRVS